MEIVNLIHEELITLPEHDQSYILDMIKHYLSRETALKKIMSASADGFKRMAEIGLLTKKMLGPYTRALLVDTGDEIYAVDPEDHVVGWELRATGGFSRDQVASLKSMLSPDDRLLIVGAHIGTVAIPLSSHCAELVVIEANPQSFQLLELNLHINQVMNCKAFNIAANDKREELSFLMSRVNSGGSKRKPVLDMYMYNYDHPLEIKVPGFPLDELLDGQKFDHIVMDIEGSEYFALKGMQRLLSLSRSLVIEFLPHHLRNVSGVSVDEFLSMLSYDKLIIPSINKTVGKDEFSAVLNYMYDNDLGDEGIIFKRDR
jgi:FkbM family methyltransferase